MIKAIAIVANPKSANVERVLLELVDILKRYRVDVLLEKRAAGILHLNWHTSHDEIRNRADVIIVLGGDGTVLSAARLADDREIPLLTIHMGRLGFITEFCVDEIHEAIDALFKNELGTRKRMRLSCDIVDPDGESVYHEHALNEIALIKGGIANMIEFEVYSNNEMVNLYKADGFIVSTPTGSTGYALSTGGPVIDPNLSLMLLTAIAPHSLFSRSLVVADDSYIKIQIITERHDIFVTQDGQVGRNLKVGESLIIKKTAFNTVLFAKPNVNFYRHLREKFFWGK